MSLLPPHPYYLFTWAEAGPLTFASVTIHPPHFTHNTGAPQTAAWRAANAARELNSKADKKTLSNFDVRKGELQRRQNSTTIKNQKKNHRCNKVQESQQEKNLRNRHMALGHLTIVT